MSEIEKIKRYIEATHMSPRCSRQYNIPIKEALSLADAADSDCTRAIMLAFAYGKAKGYRAAKAEVRKS